MSDSLLAPVDPVRAVSPVAPDSSDDPGESPAPDDRIEPDDPAGTATRLRARGTAATALLRASAEQISDQQAREPSLLPVDLGVGYSPADWPEAFATYSLEQYAGVLDGADAPATVLRTSDAPVVVRIGPAAAQPAATVTGPVRDLLAWLTGRGAGNGLSAEPPGPLPALPSL